MSEVEKKMDAASELEKKILELIKQEEPKLYSSNVAHTAVRLVMSKFELASRC